ncbi:hypothetical protein C8Q76DRAFT_791559 [Earliella scabrosa]|nr:hypothetical protein C8Q76DRAFT_791559 [Earliella scabrosa]
MAHFKPSSPEDPPSSPHIATIEEETGKSASGKGKASPERVSNKSSGDKGKTVKARQPQDRKDKGSRDVGTAEVVKKKKKAEVVEKESDEEREGSENESVNGDNESNEGEDNKGTVKDKGKAKVTEASESDADRSKSEDEEEESSDAKPLASTTAKKAKKPASKRVLKVIPDPHEHLLTPPNLDTASLPKNYLKMLLKVRSEVCTHCKKRKSDCHQSSGRTWKCQDCQTSRKFDCSWAVSLRELDARYRTQPHAKKGRSRKSGKRKAQARDSDKERPDSPAAEPVKKKSKKTKTVPHKPVTRTYGKAKDTASNEKMKTEGKAEASTSKSSATDGTKASETKKKVKVDKQSGKSSQLEESSPKKKTRVATGAMDSKAATSDTVSTSAQGDPQAAKDVHASATTPSESKPRPIPSSGQANNSAGGPESTLVGKSNDEMTTPEERQKKRTRDTDQEGAPAKKPRQDTAQPSVEETDKTDAGGNVQGGSTSPGAPIDERDASGSDENGHRELLNELVTLDVPDVLPIDESTFPSFDVTLIDEDHNVPNIVAPSGPSAPTSTPDAYVAALRHLAQAHRETSEVLANHSRILAECLRDIHGQTDLLLKALSRGPNGPA